MLRPTALRPVLRSSPRCQQCLRRNLFAGKGSTRASQDFDLNKLNSQRRDYERHRTIFLACGATAGAISFIYTAWKLKQALDEQDEKQKQKQKIAVKCDAPAIPTETFKTEAGEKRKIVVHDEDGKIIVPTGNSVVPAFPRTINVKLPTSKDTSSVAASISDKEGDEFTLVGLGVRTVTFLGIQVYMTGFYVATQDIAKLQRYLVKKINPAATTLIPAEKDALRKALRDVAEGEETWDTLLREAGCRSIFRIIPVKDTDFPHLRDGFVRAIAARSQRSTAYNDDAFGVAMGDFKALFNRGSVQKKQELLLCRDERGLLSVLYSPDKGSDPKREVMGTFGEERLSRLLWLNYLAGSKVASEPARESIIEGVMEFVERPIGTVATQVV